MQRTNFYASEMNILFTCTLSSSFLLLLSPKSQFHYQTYCVCVSPFNFCSREFTHFPSLMPKQNLGEVQSTGQLRNPATSRILLRFGSYIYTAPHLFHWVLHMRILCLGHIWNLQDFFEKVSWEFDMKDYFGFLAVRILCYSL